MWCVRWLTNWLGGSPHVPKGGNRTAGILSLVLSLLVIFGLLALIAKEIHAHFGQDRARGVY